jgi:glycosyltransferase involved in cell wall biosynthesis
LIDQRSHDIVHVNMPFNFDAAAGASSSDAALVWHFNDVLTPWPLNRLAGSIAERIADEIVVASDSVGEYFFSTSDCSFSTVYPPVDLAKFDSEGVSSNRLRDEFSLSRECTVIGTVGNVNPVKGHEYLIRAAAHIDGATEGNIFVPIAGSILESRSNYHERLEELRFELGVEDEVQFLGRLSDIPEFLSQIDVFVLPSVSEACPMAVLEAMAMETPIVATEVGGIPEQIQDGESGWLVPSKDPEALADAVVEAIESRDEAARRAENARQRVLTTFSLERCVENHRRVYHQALKENSNKKI